MLWMPRLLMSTSGPVVRGSASSSSGRGVLPKTGADGDDGGGPDGGGGGGGLTELVTRAARGGEPL